MQSTNANIFSSKNKKLKTSYKNEMKKIKERVKMQG